MDRSFSYSRNVNFSRRNTDKIHWTKTFYCSEEECLVCLKWPSFRKADNSICYASVFFLLIQHKKGMVMNNRRATIMMIMMAVIMVLAVCSLEDENIVDRGEQIVLKICFSYTGIDHFTILVDQPPP